MTLYEYLMKNGIGYDDFAHVLGCSHGYIIDIVHGRPCSNVLGDKIYSVTDQQVTITTTKGKIRSK